MPWKVMGEKWHLSRKGFPLGRPPKWPGELIEELVELLKDVAPDGQFLWNNQQLVNVFIPGQREAWATILSKKSEALELRLRGPKGQFTLGRILHLGGDRSLSGARDGYDVIHLIFRTPKELGHRDTEHGDLVAFLGEHLGQCSAPV